MNREILHPLFEWLGHSAMGMTISASSALIATIEIVHLIGMTLFVGSILAVDLTLLGFGMKRYPVARLAADLAPWTRTGLFVMLISGPVLLSSETSRCFDSSFFWVKMGLLIVALGFYFAVHQRVALAEPPAPRTTASLVASLSLSLWICVALSAKMIGIVGDDLRTAALFLKATFSV